MPKSLEFDTQKHCDTDILYEDKHLIGIKSTRCWQQNCHGFRNYALEEKWKKQNIANFLTNAIDALKAGNTRPLPKCLEIAYYFGNNLYE